MLRKTNLTKAMLFKIKQKGNLEFIITTLFISLLTILGVFMSHYNSDKFLGKIKIIETIVTPKNPINKFIGEVSDKTITITHLMRI